MGKRVGFIGVIIDERGKSVNEVNRVLSEVEDIVVARMGVPYKEKSCCVITLVVNATTDEMGALTGKLGEIQGVSIKSALSKM
ncbi:MAG: iron-only hydrogenase system regulator [Candidatus Omnitrophica bacterium]|nr:iron-only hydrogenase system regulator [Candidatus Omnitrophota bacterium]